MKVGIITTPNKKGQIVIPKKFREALGITETVPLSLSLRGEGIHIYPLTSKVATNDSYLKMLEKTQGTWEEEDTQRLKARRKIELAASRRRKQAW